MKREWGPIINQARNIVNGYNYLITLRQLHYRLVMTAGIGYTNSLGDYKRLSELTAEERRQGTFPALQDQTREIHRIASWDSPADGVEALASQYRRNRTETQDYFLCLAGEKATLLAQLNDWFNRDRAATATTPARRALGVPIVLTRGYGSQTYVDDVREMVERDGRKAVLIYAGDLDPSGEDILRDFLHRTNCWDETEHIAVREEQINNLGLTVAPGKATDSRAEGFIAKYGSLFQVEVEAIEPNDLRQMYQDALANWWNQGAYDEILGVEAEERQQLYDLVEQLRSEQDESGDDE